MRWVKTEAVEKQLGEILELMQQIEDKMDRVLDDLIQERCEHEEAQIAELKARLERTEQRLDEGEEKIFVPSKLHFV
jgi:peptidoglycan hydrolase CwlO-like protein